MIAARRTDPIWRSIKMLLFAVAIAVTGVGLSEAPASAAPETPCDLAMGFFCRFVPIAPDLEGDVDLSTQLPPAPPDESLPPANICARGCI
jgi:hypothetical protein